MGSISQFPSSSVSRAIRPDEPGGELLAMHHVDLDTVIETVRALRTLDDQSVLDCYNRLDRKALPGG